MTTSPQAHSIFVARSPSEKKVIMASPSRLLQSKRSTPIPTQLQPQSNKLSFNSLSCNNLPSLSTTGGSHQNDHELLHRPNSAHTKFYDLSTDISGYTVKDYLRSRKNFLEDFMLSEVPVAVLQKVLKRKTSSRESGFEVAATVGDAIAKLKKVNATNSMMGNLSRDVQKGLPLKSILYHLCKYTAEAAYADTFQLYLVESNYLVFVAEGEKKQVKHEVCIPVRLGDTIPGYVAATKIPVNINVIKQRADFKFPKGSSLPTKDENQVSFVLCVPILKKNEEVIGVLELGRNIKQLMFSEEDETTVHSYLSWATVAMDCSNIHKENEQSQLLFNAYNKITRLVVGDEWTFESIFECIQSTVTTLVSSENSKIFMINQSGEDLCLQLPNSRLYDTIISSESTEVMFTIDMSKQKILSQSDIVFPGLSIIKRIADYIRKTGEVLNLNDSSRKKFLDHDMDSIMAVENCKTLLCAPMKIDKQILGVIVAVNKTKNDEFTARDEAHFTSFCEFCSLVVSNCQAKREINKTKLKYQVNKEVLEYHRICSSKVLQEVKSRPAPTFETYPISKFTFDSSFLDGNTKAQLAVLMFSDLVDTSSKFDQDKLLRFFLTISKNYRPNAYHNWDHAFTVTHCLFWVIKGTQKMFSEVEKIAFFIACLCHDLDHRGTNSPFLSKTGSPISKLYSTPSLENHHFSQTVALLQIEAINIFSNFSDTEYNQILSVIRKAIMASDVTQFFKNREAMLKLNSDGYFTWSNAAHKEVAQRMLITMCDLNSTFKPWPVYKTHVDSLFEEFYAQGDIEKELGYSPMEIMDRECKHKIPDIQMHFIRSFSLSSCQLLEPLMPHIGALREGAESNITKWRESRYCSIRESTCSLQDGDN